MWRWIRDSPGAALQKAGRGGLRQKSQDHTPRGQTMKEEKRFFFISWYIGMPSPHGHSTVTLPSCPHLGKAQGSEQRGMGLTLKKHLHGFRALLPGWYCCSLYDIFWAWLAHILNKTWGAGGLWGGRTERKMSDLHPHKESVNNGV